VPKPQSTANPFYVLLLIAGILFVMTACAYFTMTVREAGGTAAAADGFTAFVARYGLAALIGELLLLAIATVGAIGTDDYWSRRRSG
jgi:hypothetical protein